MSVEKFRIGSSQEMAIALMLSRLPGAKVITNYKIKINSKVYEMDVMAITPVGIYVVESKNLTGYISGSYNDKEWLTASRHKKYLINNPIFQNKSHLRVLYSLLYEKNVFIDIFSYVCVHNRCRIHFMGDEVQHLGKLITVVRKDFDSRPQDCDVDKVYNIIAGHRHVKGMTHFKPEMCGVARNEITDNKWNDVFSDKLDFFEGMNI